MEAEVCQSESLRSSSTSSSSQSLECTASSGIPNAVAMGPESDSRSRWPAVVNTLTVPS